MSRIIHHISKHTLVYNNCKAAKHSSLISWVLLLIRPSCLVAIVTTRRTEPRETVGRKLLSLKTRRRLSQQRASRSRKQQKLRPPPHGNVAEQRAARLWTWVLRPTTLETRAQRTRYSHKLSHFSKCEIHSQLLTTVSLCFCL